MSSAGNFATREVESFRTLLMVLVATWGIRVAWCVSD
jgi:hypothetical protein